MGYHSESKMGATERYIPHIFQRMTVHFIDSTSIITVTNVIFDLNKYEFSFEKREFWYNNFQTYFVM